MCWVWGILFRLFAEIIVGAVACAIMYRGTGYYGMGRCALGFLCVIGGSCLLLSVLTTTAFCDPIFWRAEWRALSGHDPYRCNTSAVVYWR